MARLPPIKVLGAQSNFCLGAWNTGHVVVNMLVGEGFPFSSPSKFGLRYFSETFFLLGKGRTMMSAYLKSYGTGRVFIRVLVSVMRIFIFMDTMEV